MIRIRNVFIAAAVAMVGGGLFAYLSRSEPQPQPEQLARRHVGGQAKAGPNERSMAVTPPARRSIRKNHPKQDFGAPDAELAAVPQQESGAPPKVTKAPAVTPMPAQQRKLLKQSVSFADSRIASLERDLPRFRKDPAVTSAQLQQLERQLQQLKAARLRIRKQLADDQAHGRQNAASGNRHE